MAKKLIGREQGAGLRGHKCTYPTLYGYARSVEKAADLLGRARSVMEKYYDEAEIFNAVIDSLEKHLSVRANMRNRPDITLRFGTAEAP